MAAKKRAARKPKKRAKKRAKRVGNSVLKKRGILLKSSSMQHVLDRGWGMNGEGYKVVSVNPDSVLLERTAPGKTKGKRYRITVVK